MNFTLKSSLLISVILVVGIISIAPSAAFIPEEPEVKVFTFSEIRDQPEIESGKPINFTIIIKNLTNSSISNITIFQTYAENYEVSFLKLVNSPMGAYTGPVNYTGQPGTLSIKDAATHESVPINYLNVTNQNFTMNVPSLAAGKTLGIGFTLNFTRERTYSFTDKAAEVTYYDHWGDPYTVISEHNPTINIDNPEEDEVEPYIPRVPVESELDFKPIIFISLGLVVLVLVIRIVYGKNPLDI
ncbi:MAG: hypothetical protein INQ03_06570 [Candidatus Heimdallarchaeota archaeon]|nr:hypothetical protein [Candidatus Heimdallarchaeota archaeon]